MDTITEKRNLLMGERLVKNLERRHFEAHYCATQQEAVTLVNGLIASGSTVTWGGSMSIRHMGLVDALHAREDLHLLDRDRAESREQAQEMYRQAFAADVYLTSANAISEDGEVVNIDGNGNRVAAITWGPKRVIMVVGVNKVAQDLDAAIKRARSVAAPTNAQRFDITTPCKTDGRCHNCNAVDCICNYIHIMRNSYPAGRHIVVVVGEPLGY